MDATNQLGYVIHHLAFVLDRQSDQVLQERIGIGFSQFKVLMALRWHGGVQQKQVAEYLGQTEASISRQIKLMHEKGLLKISVSPKSRREHVTLLTDKGLKLSEEAVRILNQYHEPIFATLPEKEQRSLCEMLQHMHRRACSDDKPNRCQSIID